jgi:hypothetical protein
MKDACTAPPLAMVAAAAGSGTPLRRLPALTRRALPPARTSQLYVCVLSSSLWVQEEARARLLWQNERGVPIVDGGRKHAEDALAVCVVRQLPMWSARSR